MTGKVFRLSIGPEVRLIGKKHKKKKESTPSLAMKLFAGFGIAVAVLVVAFIAIAVLDTATPSDRAQYAAGLSDFSKGNGTSIRATAEGVENRTLRINADLDDVVGVGIPAMRNDTNLRQTLKQHGFKKVIVTFDVGEPVEIDLNN